MISLQYMNSAEKGATFRKSSILSKGYMPPRQTSKENDDYKRKLQTPSVVPGRKRNKQRPTFPLMLHQILEDSEKAHTQHIVAWEDDGTSFHIYDPRTFNDNILPKYSKKKTKTKFRSFQRQLNIYGFKMAKKSGVYRHPFFRRGEMTSIARIRPRPNGPKKRTERDDIDDVCENTNRSNVVSPSSDKIDVKGIESQSDPVSSRCKVVANPLEITMSKTGLNKSKSTKKGNRANNNDNDCVRDTVDITPVSSEINPTTEDPIYRLIGTNSFHFPFDRYESTISSFENPSLRGMTEKDMFMGDGVCLDSDGFGYQRSMCTMTPKNYDFDLFDDLDDIELCSCNGTGCYFDKYRRNTEL